MDTATVKSPIDLTPEQQNAFIAAKVARFKERYEKIVAETGLRHFALLSTPGGDVSIPLIILPTRLMKTGEHTEHPAAE